MKLNKAAVLSLAVLATVLLFTIPVEAFETGSSGFVYYNRAETVYPIMNQVTYNSSSFLSRYIEADNDSIYNIAPAFHKESASKGASSMPEYLSFGTGFRHKNNDTTYAVYYQYKFEDAMKAAAENGDVYLSFIADLKNDNHWNVKRHWESWTAYPTTYVSASGKRLITHDTGHIHNDAEITLGRNEFVPMGPNKYSEIEFTAYGNTCTCGSSEVSNISIMLADVVGPKVESIYTTCLGTDGTTMKKYNKFTAGDALYINLKFNEKIRFADDTAMKLSEAPKLKFKVKRISDNIQETGIAAEASLVSLDNDVLTFKYIVPETYSLTGQAVNTNYYIYEVEPYNTQTTWINETDPGFDLKLLGKDGSYLDFPQKAASCIVDLAGNPIDTETSKVALDSPAYMDNEVPMVQKMEIVRASKDETDQVNRSDVFAKAGDKIGFFVYFSEEMAFKQKSDNLCQAPDNYIYYDNELTKSGINMEQPYIGGSQIRLLAELNIGRNGIPVTALAKYMVTVQDGLSGPKISKAYFEMEEPICAEMLPIIYQGEDLPIGINRIYLDTGKDVYALSDTRGNAYQESTELVNVSDDTRARVMPAQQLWLDVAAPEASTPLSAGVAGYAPLGYGDGNVSVFYFPVIINDRNVYGEAYMSKTNGVTGYFIWRDNADNGSEYTFEYAVTGSADKPADTDYKSAIIGKKIAFTQIDTGNYIHIRLLDDVEYNIGDSSLVFYPADNAGNMGEVPSVLDYEMDRTGPKAIRDQFNQQFNNTTGTGRIDADITLWDFNDITGIEYQWAKQGEEPNGEWSNFTGYSVIPEGKYRKTKISLTYDNLASNVVHSYKLYIRGKDVLGNICTTSFDFEYNLILTQYNVEFVTNPGEPLAQHSMMVYLPENYNYDNDNCKGGSNIILQVAVPDKANMFYVKEFNLNEICGVNNAVDILKVGYNPADEGWWVYNLEVGADYISYVPASTFEYYDRQKLYNVFNGTYGKVQITVICTKGDYNLKLPNGMLYAKDTYTINFANADKIDINQPIHTIAITPETPVSYSDYNGQPDTAYDTRPTSPSLPNSLDGALFNVSLSNAIVPEYKLADIDFESKDTYFALYKTGEGASGEPLFTAPLIQKESQNIIIHTGAAVANGTYKVVVSVKCRNSYHIDKKEFTNIMIDGRKTDTYGVTEVKTKKTLENGKVTLPEEAFTEYDISPENHTSEILVSAAPDADQSVLFKTDLPSITLGTETVSLAYIKVWNESEWIPENRFKWIPIAGQRLYKTALLTLDTQSKISAALQSSSPEVAAVIPVVPGDNIVKYQIITTSGYETSVQTLLIRAETEKPVIEMQLSPEKAAETAIKGNVTASIKELNSSVVSPDTLQVGLAFPDGVEHEGDLKADFKASRQVTITENGDYYFYAIDKYHNYGYQKVTVDYIDNEGPAINVTNQSNTAKNTYNFDVNIADNFSTENCKLYIGFDDVYSNVLGVEAGTFFEVNTRDSWKATEISKYGIYETSVTYENANSKTVSISGAWKYDDTVGAAAVERAITIYAVDGAGNISGQYNVTLNTENETASFINGKISEGSYEAAFNKPVLLTMPNVNTLNPVYSYAKSNLPFYSNGVYHIKFRDIFGDTHENDIMVDQYDSLYSSTVSISETAPTNKDVKIIFNAAFNPDITLELPDSIAGADIEKVHDGQGNVVGASITMSQNGTITYKLVPKDSTFAAQTRTVEINNIDKTPPVVKLVWVYTSKVDNGLTAGDITASLYSDETLNPVQDTGTIHTFTLDSQTPYTFYYEDLAGNSGSITAAPLVKIVEKAITELDNDAPDYEMDVYRSINGIGSVKAAGYNRGEYEQLVNKADAFPLFSGILQLRFRIFDANQTTLSIKEGPVAGVSIAGTTVSVSQNAEFTVVITDAKNNRTEVPVSITKGDNTPPDGTVTYVKTGAFTIRGYLTMNDNRPDGITLKNTNGVQVETKTGEYQGKYYHDFLDNESFTFIFADAAGNTGSVIAAVTTLDMTSPEASISQWVPYFIDANGVKHKGQLSDTVTNSDVEVYIQFSKPVQKITPAIMDSIGDLKDITVKQTEDSVSVIFRQNAKVRLTYTALNRRSGDTVLEVNIIDKTAPVITSDKTAGDSKSVTYTFTSDEDVFCENIENAQASGKSFIKVFYLNGSYDLKFTDRAGNSSVSGVTVSGIDREAPGITVTDLPATKESVEAYNLANGTSLKHKTTNQSVIVNAFINEAGTIRFNGVTYEVNSGQQVPLTINYNGTYEVVATDLSGMTIRYQFSIDCIDKSRPQILLSGGSLTVKQGTSEADFESEALKKVIVSDTCDMNPDVTLSKGLTDIQLNTPGTYSIEFTAVDEAGNQQTTSYFARVYDGKALEVRVNGELAQPDETMFIGGDSRVINIKVDNLPTGAGGQESYRLYWKSGLNTAGQMKNATLFTDNFTAPDDGFYTIYLVTQSRKSFNTYIYIQKSEVVK